MSDPIFARPASFRPQELQALEKRLFLSITAPGSDGVVVINDGSDTTSDVIVVSYDSSANQFVFNDNGTVESFAAASVQTTQIQTGSGNDSITFNTALPGTTDNSGRADGISTQGGNDTVMGSTGRQIIFGGAGADYIQAFGSGGAEIRGGSGSDTLVGAAGNDTIVGGQGNNLLRGGAGDDNITAGTGNDTLFGGQGNDTLDGGAGDDSIMGGKGNDYLTGDAGNDYLIGGAGDDTLLAGQGDDTAIGGAGNDSMRGGAGDDVLIGDGEGMLTTEGGTPTVTAPGNDVLVGGLGNDTLLAYGGTDSLSGDTLYGGAGNNDFDSRGSANVLGDFNSSQGDFQPSQQTYATGTATAVNFAVTLKIVVDGQTVAIPNGAGSFDGVTSIAQVTGVADDGTATIQFTSPTSRTFTLADFFNQWGIPLTAEGVGQYAADVGGHTLTLTNTTASVAQPFASDPQTFQVQSGDQLTLTYV
jgi:Ca2+-binding RTX toxin-like protein